MRQKEPSAAPNRYASCDWYYHVPLKHNEKKSEVVIPPTSQIPGLSDVAEPHNDLMSGSRKKWIKDSDSDYVKLAKQGGRSDLLKHTTSAPKKSPPASYAPPDWYTYDNLTPPPEPTGTSLRNVPDYMIHEEHNLEENEQKYEAKKGPFDFDQKTVWQRESEENEKENHHDKKVKLPAINTNVTASGKGPPPTKNRHDRPGKKCFFPPMPANKNDSVNFGKLLSNGYGDDWLHQYGEQERKAKQKPKTFKSYD